MGTFILRDIHETIVAGQTGQFVIAPNLLVPTTLWAKVAGTAGYTATFSLEASPDRGVSWYDMKVVDLTGSSLTALASNVALSTDGAHAIAHIPWSLPGWELRVTIAATTHDVTVDAWLSGGDDDAI